MLCFMHYRLAGMNPHTMGQFIVICMFVNSVGVVLGLAISSFAPNIDAANAIGPVFVIIGVLFGGFYIKISSLPIILNLIPYLSLFRWGFQALTINEFTGRTYNCDTNPSLCLTTGEEVLQTLSYDGYSVRYPLFGLGMILVAYFVGLYVLLLMNKLRYAPLGHIGSFYMKHADPALTANIKQSKFNHHSYNDNATSQSQQPYEIVAQSEGGSLNHAGDDKPLHVGKTSEKDIEI